MHRIKRGDKLDNISYFLSILPVYLSTLLNCVDARILHSLNEIRLRRSKPVVLVINGRSLFIDINSNLTDKPTRLSVIIDDAGFDSVTDKLCNHSYHTNMENMIQGFITTKNGCRVGIASTPVYKDGKISSVREITSLNIRIAREYKNCSEIILSTIYNDHLPSIIVCGAPSCGKTTFLRDYARMISDGYKGKYEKVVIVDERKEMSSGFDVGVNTDILYGYRKKEGIELATRTLSPKLIVCDEIGTPEELEAISYGFSSGICFAVSAHTNDSRFIYDNQIVNALIKTNQFDYIINLLNYTNDYRIINLREDKLESSRNYNDNPFYFFNWSDDFGV